MDDILSELQSELFWKDSPWIKTPTTPKGHFAVFPKTVKDESAWERSALKMHSEQAPVVMPPDKPHENMLMRKRMMMAVDGVRDFTT